MNPVGKALWFIEAHLGGDASLADIAGSSGVSRYQLLRAFGTATGHSVMRYVRGRRLSEAARLLAAGAPDILTVALDAGYGSHEAFTRAFRDQFGSDPRSGARATLSRQPATWWRPSAMDESLIVTLDPPRFETGRTLLVAGLGERYSFETNHGIPLQWQRFVPYIGNIPGQVGNVAYGVCCNSDGAGNFEYIAGVEVSSFDEPACRIAPGAHPGAALRGVHPSRPYLRDARHGLHDLEQVAAKIRPRSRRCAGFRALRRTGSIRRPARGKSRYGCRSRRDPAHRDPRPCRSSGDDLGRSAATAAAAWPVARPEDAGFAPDLLDKLDAGVRSGLLGGLHAVLVTRNDRLVLERYCQGADEAWGQAARHGHVRSRHAA